MRRLALSLVTSCAIATLTACSGGYGFNTGGNQTPTSIQFTNGSSQANDFFVSYQGSSPVLVVAQAVKGTGATATVIPDVQFTWSAAFAPAGTIYHTGSSPNGQAECGTPSQTPLVNSLLQQGKSGGAFPFYNGFYTQLNAQQILSPPAINGGPNYTQQAPEIYVGPPTVPVADPKVIGQFDASSTAILPATGSTNYCLNLIATAQPSGVQGGIIVVVEP
jgi:hypothetical protein